MEAASVTNLEARSKCLQPFIALIASADMENICIVARSLSVTLVLATSIVDSLLHRKDGPEQTEKCPSEGSV